MVLMKKGKRNKMARGEETDTKSPSQCESRVVWLDLKKLTETVRGNGERQKDGTDEHKREEDD